MLQLRAVRNGGPGGVSLHHIPKPRSFRHIVYAFCFAEPQSCGLVIRRINKNNGSVLERWSKSGEQVVGWVPCTDDDLDPDPARRRPRVTSGNPEIDKRLVLPASPYNAFSESVTTLFPAPPNRFFGVFEKHRYETLTLAALMIDGEQALTVAPAQYQDGRDRTLSRSRPSTA